MTFEEICKLSKDVTDLYLEATAVRVLLDDGVTPGRVILDSDAARERAAKRKPDPNFCREQLWFAIPGKRGYVGMRFLLRQFVGPVAQNPKLRNEEAQAICESKFLQDMPPCKHAPDKIIEYDGMQLVESLCTRQYPTPDGTCNRDEGKEGVGPLIKRLRDSANSGEQQHHAYNLQHQLQKKDRPNPAMIDVTPIDDLAEPIFLVKDEADAKQLAINLEIDIRWRERKISTWYGRNAILIADADACKKIIKAKLKKENVLGGLGWKPVVLTFPNAKLAAKLSEIGLAVTETDGLPESLDTFRKNTAVIQPSTDVKLADIPESALDGWLGKVCRERMADFPRAFAWPALLVVAGALVEESPIRTNLYVGLIGEVGSGKTSAIRKAIWLLGMVAPALVEEKFGSGEGLATRIGDVGNSARLWFPDELGHTMAKAQIQNATFPETLTTAWSTNQNNATIARQKVVAFSCRLSIAGGLVTDRFGDAFGSAATGGLWDRFIFGECPSGFSYAYRPNTGSPEITAGTGIAEDDLLGMPSELRKLEGVEDGVWDERDRWVKEEGINRRVAENALRVAAICAVFDGRPTLRAADLGPSLEFARYQERMRGLHKPNPGRNESGIVYHRLIEYLERHSADEEWLEQRRMVQNTHAYDFGMGVVERTLDAMETAGQIERKKQGRKPLVRKRI